jgi:hypothetical protein
VLGEEIQTEELLIFEYLEVISKIKNKAFDKKELG